MDYNRINEILTSTSGELGYTQQLVLILVECGFSKEDGDNIRKSFAKKKLDEMERWKSKIKEKCDEKIADFIIDEMTKATSMWGFVK